MMRACLLGQRRRGRVGAAFLFERGGPAAEPIVVLRRGAQGRTRPVNQQRAQVAVAALAADAAQHGLAAAGVLASTRPTNAPSARALGGNCRALPTLATAAVAVIGPTSGIAVGPGGSVHRCGTPAGCAGQESSWRWLSSAAGSTPRPPPALPSAASPACGCAVLAPPPARRRAHSSLRGAITPYSASSPRSWLALWVRCLISSRRALVQALHVLLRQALSIPQTASSAVTWLRPPPRRH